MGIFALFGIGETVDKAKALQMNPVVLAFLGDAVYSLYVREKFAFHHDCKANELHRLSAGTVNAGAQAAFADRIMELLTEEELSVFKRARNAKKTTRAKNSSVAEYNKSTGLEALLGYLYVTGEYKRLSALLAYSEEKEWQNGF